MADLKTALEAEDTSSDDLKAKTDVLMQASMKLGEMVYRKQQEEQAAEGGTDAEGMAAEAAGDTPDDVVDADFTEVDEDNPSDSDDDDKKSA